MHNPFPKNLIKDDYSVFKEDMFTTESDVNIIELRNIITTSFGFLIKSGELYHASIRDKNISYKYKVINILLKFSFWKRKNTKSGYWVIDNWTFGYYHIISDLLPKLVWLSKNRNPNIPIILPLALKKSDVLQFFLNRISLPVIYVSEWETIKIDELYWITNNDFLDLNKSVLTEFKSLLPFSLYDEIPTRLTYISRKKASRRKVENSEEVESFLKSFGFDIHFFENYSFYDQMKISASSKVICGPHGGGLTNLIFMNPNTSIFEFRKSNNHLNNCFYRLACLNDMDYYYQFCTSPTPARSATVADIIVDLEKLKNNVEVLFYTI